MSRWNRPLKAAEVRKILRALGFESKPLKATSHEQWTKRDGESFYKVTLSAHKSVFVSFMMR
jgi:predicted RNA binding protein YcfA (HicA-like mRNA interferase family)